MMPAPTWLKDNQWTAERIKALRLRLRLTQTEFADYLGVDFRSVNRWENGHVAPSPMAQIRLRRAEDELNAGVRK